MGIGAILWLALAGWFGASDLLPFVLWSTPLALALLLLTVQLGRATENRSLPIRYLAASIVGPVTGLTWTVVPFLCLGPWFYAFSLPVGALWLAGSIVAFLANVAITAPRTWPVSAAIAIITTGSLLFASYWISRPPPDMIVILADNATSQQVQAVHDHGLGTSTERGLYPLEGIQAVSGGTYEGNRAIVVSFHPGTDEARIAYIRSRVLAMPGVLQVVFRP